MSGIEAVEEWWTLPDVADRLGLDLGKVRRLVQERHVVGLRRGERPVLRVPAAFFVPLSEADVAARAAAAQEQGRAVASVEIVPGLPGTLTLLTDIRLTDEEIVDWFFSADDMLGETPAAALRSGRKSAVRRAAQLLG